MEYISSDTNVWLDFKIINHIDYPFRLSYQYIMNEDAIEDELLSPNNLASELKTLGLIPVELTTEEFFYADSLSSKYPKLSKYDRIALSIAKLRKITLLTGDGALRKAAIKEEVEVIGTIRLIDLLYEENKINKYEYLECLTELLRHNGNIIRLPQNELQSRIKKIL